MPTLSASNAALLIDFDNVTLGVRSDLTKELRHLLDSDIIKGKVSVQRAYADWRRYPQYIVPLSESSIDLIFAPAFGTNKKNATDIRLAIDATELVFTRPEIGTFILLSGDSDFSSLVIKLKEYGKYVIGVGIRESASDILIQNCDEYYSYSELAGLTKEVDTPSTQRDPWELVVEAVAQMTANRDVMRADRLKQVMQQLDPNFDESNAGFNRFSKFVQEAGSRGLIKVTKMENGQFEVAPGRSPGATPSEATKSTREGSRADEREGSRGGTREGSTGADRDRGRSRRGRGRGDAKQESRTEAKPEPRPEPKPEPKADAEPEKEKERGRRRRRGGRGRSRGGEERATAPADEAPAAPPRDQLTLAEAFHLLTRALGELPAPVAHETLRARMAALHGREDALLDEVTFPRLLRQANDAEVADVRMLDETHFEVSPHKTDLALQRRPAAESAEPGVPTVTVTPAAPRSRLRSSAGGAKRAAAVPLVGVFKLDGEATPAEADAPTADESAAEAKPAPKPKKRSTRKKSARAKAASTTAAASAEKATTEKASAPKRTKKAAAKSTKKAAKSSGTKKVARKRSKSAAKSTASKDSGKAE
ncbi:MAG TPA: NYN domain-containing protein [Gemmatimonadales bacterium]|nr:NYN domain-containing protein [Gemmatimonadales bacterium]